MSHRGGLAFYVTSHGFGHLNRSCAVINKIPLDVPVTIRSDPSMFEHWGERLRRPARLEPHTSDVGAINPPGDSSATDGPATLALAAEVHARAMAEVDDEAARLRDEGTAALLCDATPVPLVAARRAGIPGFLQASFTWADIYRSHAKKLGPEAMATVRAIEAAYRQATTLFRTEPALKMTGVAPTIEVGMIVTPGVDRRVELRRTLGISPSEKVVYFYIGRYGQENLGWERLAKLEGVHFVGFHEAPSGPLPNLHAVPATEWTGADLAASADVIVAKAGYGTACEAMVARTPFIYPPRSGFAEHRALERVLGAWGGGIRTPARDFAELRIERQLEKAFAMKPGPAPYPADGASRVAGHLLKAIGRTRHSHTEVPDSHLRSQDRS